MKFELTLKLNELFQKGTYIKVELTLELSGLFQ